MFRQMYLVELEISHRGISCGTKNKVHPIYRMISERHETFGPVLLMKANSRERVVFISTLVWVLYSYMGIC